MANSLIRSVAGDARSRIECSNRFRLRVRFGEGDVMSDRICQSQREENEC